MQTELLTDRSKITKETYLNWYVLMQRIRRFEEKAGQLYGMQKIRGFCHLYIGQEAVAAGAISAIRQEDPIITAYRDHGLELRKALPVMKVWPSCLEKLQVAQKEKVAQCTFF